MSSDNFDSAELRQKLPALRFEEQLSLFTWERRVKAFYDFSFITNHKILELTNKEELIFRVLIDKIGECTELDSLFSKAYMTNMKCCSESYDIRNFFYNKTFILTECYTFLRIVSEFFMKIDNIFIFNLFFDAAELIKEEIFLELGLNKCNSIILYKLLCLYFFKYILKL